MKKKLYSSDSFIRYSFYLQFKSVKNSQTLKSSSAHMERWDVLHI